MDEVVGWNDIARRTLHRLDDDGRDLALGIVLEDVAQVLRAGEPAGGMLEIPGAAVAIGIGRMMHPRRKRTLVIAVAAPEEANRACGLAVVAAPEADELELLCDRFGEPEGGLDRLGAAREQLDVGDALRQELADQVEKARAILGREAAEGDAAELLGEASDVVRMGVADAADRDAGDEIQVFVAVDIDDGAALGVVHHDLRVERDRLQPRRHRCGLAIEDRLGLGAGHGTALSVFV